MTQYSDYLRYQHLQEQGVLRRIDELLSRLAELNATFEEDEVAVDVAAAVAEARTDSGNKKETTDFTDGPH